MNQKSTLKEDNVLEPTGEKMIEKKDGELIRFFECLCTIEELEKHQNNLIPNL